MRRSLVLLRPLLCIPVTLTGLGHSGYSSRWTTHRPRDSFAKSFTCQAQGRPILRRLLEPGSLKAAVPHRHCCQPHRERVASQDCEHLRKGVYAEFVKLQQKQNPSTAFARCSYSSPEAVSGWMACWRPRSHLEGCPISHWWLTATRVTERAPLLGLGILTCPLRHGESGELQDVARWQSRK